MYRNAGEPLGTRATLSGGVEHGNNLLILQHSDAGAR